jgi:hypothetical protein
MLRVFSANVEAANSSCSPGEMQNSKTLTVYVLTEDKIEMRIV